MTLDRSVPLTNVAGTCEWGGVFAYGLFDFDPEAGGNEEAGRARAAASWRTWDAGAGRGSTFNGRGR